MITKKVIKNRSKVKFSLVEADSGFLLTYSAVHNSGATLQNCPFCKFQVEFMICALIVYGQVIYFCKGFATRILLKKIFFLK